MKIKKLQQIKLKRIKRIRSKIKGTKEMPRLCATRTNKHIYAQLIDDINHHTLISASSYKYQGNKINKTEMAKFVGKLIAQKAKEKGIEKAVFDKRHYKYHGRIRALVESARENGLKI